MSYAAEGQSFQCAMHRCKNDCLYRCRHIRLPRFEFAAACMHVHIDARPWSQIQDSQPSLRVLSAYSPRTPVVLWLERMPEEPNSCSKVSPDTCSKDTSGQTCELHESSYQVLVSMTMLSMQSERIA